MNTYVLPLNILTSYLKFLDFINIKMSTNNLAESNQQQSSIDEVQTSMENSKMATRHMVDRDYDGYDQNFYDYCQYYDDNTQDYCDYGQDHHDFGQDHCDYDQDLHDYDQDHRDYGLDYYDHVQSCNDYGFSHSNTLNTIYEESSEDLHEINPNSNDANSSDSNVVDEGSSSDKNRNDASNEEDDKDDNEKREELKSSDDEICQNEKVNSTMTPSSVVNTATSSSAEAFRLLLRITLMNFTLMVIMMIVATIRFSF